MKSLSVLLFGCVAMALAAPQVPSYHNSHVVLPSGHPTGHQYTLTNRPQGFSIQTGAASAAPAAVRAAVAPVAVRTAVAPVAVQPATAYYNQHQAASAAQFAAAQQHAAQAAARKAVVVSAQPAPIHYASLPYSAQFAAAQDQASTHYVADQSAAFAAKQSANHRSAAAAQAASAQQYSAAGFRSAHIAPSANIVHQQQDISDDGSAFTYGFESDNGIAVQSQGNLKVFGPEQAGHSVSGSYSYVGDDGQTYTVNYVADETGFHASGAHLPQMSEEIARSVEYNLAHPEEWTQK